MFSMADKSPAKNIAIHEGKTGRLHPRYLEPMHLSFKERKLGEDDFA
jgi:hypothetical protein